MKNIPLTDLAKILSAPENQPMGTLMDACRQAAVFIKNEQMIWKKGAEFAKLFADKPVGDIPDAPVSEETKPAGFTAPDAPANPAPLEWTGKPTSGGLNIYVSGIRPVKGGLTKEIRMRMLTALREASGEPNGAPRMTLQKANEIVGNLELGDQMVFIRSTTSPDDATEIVQELQGVGFLAELKK